MNISKITNEKDWHNLYDNHSNENIEIIKKSAKS
jgi:hypothetical protein